MEKDFGKLLFDAYVSKTQCPYFEVKLAPLENETLTQSKLGGLPYLESVDQLPLAESDRRPLRLLLQLNFADLPENSKYPDSGLLQIWLPQDHDLYGMNFDDLTHQGDWRVVFHPQLKVIELGDVADLISYDSSGAFPLRENFALTFHESVTIPSSMVYFFDDLAQELAQDLGHSMSIDDIDDFAQIVHESKYPIFGSKIGGYPTFTQYDVRDYDQYEDYTELLFCLDSESARGKINLGDAGIMNFLIQGEALARADFSKIIYSWDCY